MNQQEYMEIQQRIEREKEERDKFVRQAVSNLELEISIMNDGQRRWATLLFVNAYISGQLAAVTKQVELTRAKVDKHLTDSQPDPEPESGSK